MNARIAARAATACSGSKSVANPCTPRAAPASRCGREDLIDQENALSIFRRPCDNCAWRKGSPERSDPDKWEHLQQQIHYCGATFYCHKGVPLSDEEGQTHDQPKLPNGKHNTKNMRLCAGYLAQRLRMAEGGLL